MHYFSRFETAAIVVALGVLVAGVSLLTVPNGPPAGSSRTVVDGIFVLASPSPSAGAVPPPALQVDAPTPSPAATITLTGPGHISPWTTADYQVTFAGAGGRAVELWWSGAAMGDWTWQRLDGHCDLTPGRDTLSGTVLGRVVVQLQLTPSGAPGGQLVFYGRDSGGQTYTLGSAIVS